MYGRMLENRGKKQLRLHETGQKKPKQGAKAEEAETAFRE